MPKKTKKFYAQPIAVGSSALSIPGNWDAENNLSQLVGFSDETSAKQLSVKDIIKLVLPTEADPNGITKVADAARLTSIIIPAGIKAKVDFMDGRCFEVYSADRPTKVRPSMLAPAHMWREVTNTSVKICSVTVEIDRNAVSITDSPGDAAINRYKRYVASKVIFNMAVRII